MIYIQSLVQLGGRIIGFGPGIVAGSIIDRIYSLRLNGRDNAVELFNIIDGGAGRHIRIVQV